MIEARLTTVDNPHSPFEDFDSWFQWDLASGYRSVELLGRIAFDSYEMSDYDQNLANTQAIDEIVEINASGMHKKVTREVPDP